MKKRTKAAAWLAAPKMMFTAKHPKRAAMLGAASWAADRLGRRKRRSTSMASMAARGLGTAAIAVPLGMWVGRKVRRTRRHAGQHASQPA